MIEATELTTENEQHGISKVRFAIYVSIVIFVMVIWGFSYVIIRLTVSENIIPPFTLGFLRFLIATIVLRAVPTNKRIIRPGRRDNINILFMGFTGVFLYFAFENYGLIYTTATNASILIALAPAFTLIGAAIFFKQKITFFNVAGMIVAFVASAFVVWNGKVNFELNPMGDLLIVLSAVSWAAYTLLGRKIVKRYDSVVIARRIILTGMVLFAPFSFYEVFSKQLHSIPTLALLGVLYLGVFCTALAFILWNKMLASLGIVYVTNLIYFQCMITMFCAWITIREPITPMLIGASVVVIAGVYLSNMSNLPSRFIKERRVSGICH